MSRDRTARARVRQFLTSGGPVVDASGYASGALKDAIGYEGSSVAFIQLIASMERDGEIVREIRGKRTYRISAGASASAGQSQTDVPSARSNSTFGAAGAFPAIQIDYDLLARSIVRELFAEVAAPAVPNPIAAQPSSEDMRRAERAYAQRLAAARQELDELLAGAEHLSADGVPQR